MRVGIGAATKRYIILGKSREKVSKWPFDSRDHVFELKKKFFQSTKVHVEKAKGKKSQAQNKREKSVGRVKEIVPFSSNLGTSSQQ